jgi:(1->4)-alpha-D-glucan 1-alpha-D-glucosylmutase
MTPRATYRLQFHKDFPFAAGAELAPYLARLGVSHAYASPILTARAGSMHGYDVVDHTRINPELGGEEGFVVMAEALKAAGLGIIVDIVPNHMAVGGADNGWWLDVLEKGQDSAYAKFFDIDFDSLVPNLKGKILAPFLGDPYEEVLKSGDIKVVLDETLGKVAVAYHHHRFPIRPQDRNSAIADLTRFDDPQALHALLEQQNFVLSWWRTAGDQINWRRFFDVTELAALRIEVAEVFDAVHSKVFDLYRNGLVDGVRVDHVDGLTDPAGYCTALRSRLDELAQKRESPARAYILVEKILGHGENLPTAWKTDGTTGYDFMNQVSALQHAPEGEAPLSAFWAELSGRSPDFEPEELAAREEMLRTAFDQQLAAVSAAFYEIAQNSGTRDLTEQSIHRALVHLIRHLRVYRTYATGLTGSPPPGEAFDAALAAARAEAPAEALALDFVAETITSPDAMRALRRFNQLTAPVAAKAVEDTAFYRYGRLLSRNDVGFEPARLSIGVEAFHAAVTARATDYPNAMLNTATHDHKRGEDVRARLAVLSEIADRWQAEVLSWFEMNVAIRPEGLAADDEYQLYQTLVGTWPLDLADDDADGLARFRERIAGWRLKSLREAKLRSSWAQPDSAYEEANARFLESCLGSGNFRAALGDFVLGIAPAGALNGIVQTALRLLLPGVPDLYQGTEFWDFSLVDPDNRRPVDYAARSEALDGTDPLNDLARNWIDGQVKQSVIATLLKLRAREPALFSEGDYRPVSVQGARAGQTIAFARRRGDVELVAALPIRCADTVIGTDRIAPAAGWWEDTRLILDVTGGELDTVIGSPGANADGQIRLSQMGNVPALVLLHRL